MIPIRLRTGRGTHLRTDSATTPSRGVRLASLAMMGAALLVGGALVSAVRTTSLATAGRRPELPTVPLLPSRRKAPSDAQLRLASDHNVFSPDRRRGGVFQPGPSGAETDDGAASAPATPQPDHVSLLGTAIVTAGRSFVVCTANGGPYQLVRLGDRCGDLTLEGVQREQGEFRGPDGKLVTIELPREGAR